MPTSRFFEKCQYCGGQGMHGVLNGEPCPLGVQEAISHRYSAQDFPANKQPYIEIDPRAWREGIRTIPGTAKCLWVAEVLTSATRTFYVVIAATAEDARVECCVPALKASDFTNGGQRVTVAKFVYPAPVAE